MNAVLPTASSGYLGLPTTKRHLLVLFYFLKPAIPRRCQLWMRRRLASRKLKTFGNVWPINASAGRRIGWPDGWKWPGWPDNKPFALVLQHDVETQTGHDRCRQLMDLEERLGFRSTFYFVPERYFISEALLREVQHRGFGLGVHGLKHDGKLFSSKTVFTERAKRINAYLKQWNTMGFSTPSMIRNHAWMHQLDMEYCTSTFDTDPFEPQSDGVGTIFPYRVTPGASHPDDTCPPPSAKPGFIELPYTLPQDHGLFVVLKQPDISIWKSKIDWIAKQGGMALLNSHPDYMQFGTNLRDAEEYPAEHYEAFLNYVRTTYEHGYWHPLSSDMARFWREQTPAENASPVPFVRAEEERQPPRALPRKQMRTSSSATTRIGALITGGDFQALGAIRTLGRKGIPVMVLEDEYSISRHSRFATKVVRSPPLSNPSHYVEFLLDLAEKEGLDGWVVFPSSDQAVCMLSQNREVLEKFYRITTPPWQVIRYVYDKKETYQLAEKNGIPIPQTWYPESLDHLMTLDLEFPLVLKPSVRDNFYSKVKIKAFRANNRDELAQDYQRLCAVIDPGEVLVQQFIAGGPQHLYSFCPFFKKGEVLTSIMGRRSRQHPMEFGHASTFVELVDIPEMRVLAERFLRLIGYYGIGEIEFMHDQNDNRLKLIEMNPRIWGWHSLAIAAGADLPYLLYQDMVGEELSLQPISHHAKWVRLITDVPTVLQELTRGRMTTANYLTSMKGKKEFAVFSSDDPLPAIAELAMLPYLYWKRGF